MYFSSLSVMNFGPFDQSYVAFRPGGVSVIVGGNASGKTQRAGAIVAAIVGKTALRMDEDGNGPTVVELTVTEDGHLEVLRLAVFRQATGEVALRQSSDGTVESGKPHGELAFRLMGAWSDPNEPRLLLDAEALRSHGSAKDVEVLESQVPDRLKQSYEWQRLHASGAFEGRPASGGQAIMSSLLGEVIRDAPVTRLVHADEALRSSYSPREVFVVCAPHRWSPRPLPACTRAARADHRSRIDRCMSEGTSFRGHSAGCPRILCFRVNRRRKPAHRCF